MKFSFYTDIHLTDNIPRYRIDNYIFTLVYKLQSVYEQSLANGCQCVTFGGDFFDRQKVADFSVIQAAIKIIQDSGLKTYACIGEHDLYGHNPNTFPDSALAFLCEFAPNFQNLWEPIHLDNGVSFYAKHEWQKMEDVQNLNLDTSRYNVLLCHELLYNKKMPFGIINTSDLDLPFDLVCSGDLHCGYAPHKIKNTWYCNPGSLARKATSDGKRMPKIFIIEVHKGYEPLIIDCKLPVCKVGTDVFSKGLGDIIRDFESGIDMTKFIQGFDEFKTERTDIYTLFDNFKMEHPVKQDVIDYIETLKKAKEESIIK